MKIKRNFMSSIPTLKESFYKGVVMVALLFSVSFNSSALTCVETATTAGFDNNNIVATVNPINCQGAGVITAVTLDASIGSACMFGWYSYEIKVNGVSIATYQCDQTGLDLTSYLPITSVSITSSDGNFIPNSVTLNLALNITYNANFCSGAPVAGSTVASTPVVCSGDTVDLTLSGQSTTIGIGYQWQSSLDNNSWTNMVNDTLLTASTTLSNTSFYRCIVSCASSGLSDTSIVDSVILGFCTPISDTTCSANPGPTTENVLITGWQGQVMSDGIVTFSYSASTLGIGDFLTVTDLSGNVLGQLWGSPLGSCAQSVNEITIPLAQLNTLLSAGNGSLELVINTPTYLPVWCNNFGYSFCITGSLRAATHIYGDDAQINSVVTPAMGSCDLDSNLTVALFNGGLNTLTSAQLNWELNGVSQLPVSWTGSIPSLSSDTVTIGVLAGGFANFDTLSVWSTLPNGSMDSNTVLDTTTQVIHEALHGTYVIASTGGDFISFSQAIITLESYGVCGPVIFEAIDPTYFEQLIIKTDNISGVNGTNTITFTSQSGDPDDVELTYSSVSSLDNFVVNITESEYVSFKNITLKNLGTVYSTVIFSPLGGDNNHITFENCVFSSLLNSSTSPSHTVARIRGANNNNWRFINNEFKGGSHGLHFGENNPIEGDSNWVVGNRFLNQKATGIYVRGQSNPLIKDNYVVSPQLAQSSATAISLTYFSGEIEISGNHVEGSPFWPRTGMYLGTVTASASNRAEIFNNRIYLGAAQSYRALYCYALTNADVSHNSVFKHGNVLNTSMALQLSNCDSIDIKNNIVQVSGFGFGLYISGSSSAIINSDYNNIAILDSGYIAYDNGDTLETLSQWVTSSGLDSNSLAVEDVFQNLPSLRVCGDSLYQMGTSLPNYPFDFEGDLRQNPPCIGADEFIPLADFGYNDSPEICTGDTLVLEQFYYDTVIWWPSMIMSNTLMITTPGSYGVAVSGGCGSDTSMFTVIPQINASIGDTNLCEGTTANLTTGISNGTYLWSDGSTDSNLIVNSPQTVSVSVISAWGCNSTDSAIITQSFDVVLPDSSTFCEGSSVVLDANMAGTYLWDDGSTGQTLAVTSSGIYSLTVSEQNCMSFDSTFVTEIFDPIPSFTESSHLYAVVFTNTSMHATSYLWDFGDGASSTVEHPTHVYPWTNVDSMTYLVTLTATNSCGDLDFSKDVLVSTVGIGEFASVGDFNMYPNPNEGEFIVDINTPSPKALSVEVMDLRGVVVFQQSFGVVNGNVSKKINLDSHAKGVYLVKLTLDGESVVRRISVK